jgi:hypothetical protein
MIYVIRTMEGKTLPMLLGVIGLLLVLTGCANNYPSHIAYTDTSEEGALVTGIQTYQFNLTTGPRYMQAGAAAKDGQVGDLHGASTRHATLFGLVEWGGNGVGEAARNGGLREVRTVQNGGVDILWGVVYSEQTTIVTGSGAYSNPLPLNFPPEAKILEEGIFLEPNGNLVVKNKDNQVTALVKKGEMNKEFAVGKERVVASYGMQKEGHLTILILPASAGFEPVLLVNDQIASFRRQGSLIIVLDDEGYVKGYESNPPGSVKIVPLPLANSELAASAKKETGLVP